MGDTAAGGGNNGAVRRGLGANGGASGEESGSDAAVGAGAQPKGRDARAVQDRERERSAAGPAADGGTLGKHAAGRAGPVAAREGSRSSGRCGRKGGTRRAASGSQRASGWEAIGASKGGNKGNAGGNAGKRGARGGVDLGGKPNSMN
ncbi:MAG: hypothetical protein EBU46_19535 [Nitrosomonadaceae bacterium]|nr:hypothetical protein [Nitrosomonadaceae bacterium]